MTNRSPCATEELSILQKIKTKKNCTLKLEKLKQFHFFIQLIFIKHLLHFPDTILGTESIAAIFFLKALPWWNLHSIEGTQTINRL